MPLEYPTRAYLLGLARTTIAARLGRATVADPRGGGDPALQEKRASFVTLKRQGALRGCIGVLEAVRPLIEDVSHNAQAAAFQDPRFKPLQELELEDLHIEISVLSPPQPLVPGSRDELLRHLSTTRTGLILQEGSRRATFLPAVWESLPDAEDFLGHLMQKAGLSARHWSPTLRLQTYLTESFSESS